MYCDLKISELFQAYYDCRKTKRNTWNAISFEQNLERNLMDLYYELVSCQYRPGRSIMFVVERPKPREVWAANFRDRVVHHVLYNRYAVDFYRRFIYDSYACIPEKGTLRAANRVQHFIRSATQNHTQPAWFLKADIANFFVSIDKLVLEKLLFSKITDQWWQWLTRTVLHNEPQNNVFIKSDKALLSKVPAHKSLLNAKQGTGLPIGNLSSQFFANVYLDELDQFAKNRIGLKFYVRYVDDVVAIDNSGERLDLAYSEMQSFLKSFLGLSFHPAKKQINLVKHGINFVGYIIKPRCKYIRRSTIDTFRKKCKNIVDFESARPVVNSYFGMMRHANAYNERKIAAMNLGKIGCWFSPSLTKLVRMAG